MVTEDHPPIADYALSVARDALWTLWHADGAEPLIRADCENGARAVVAALTAAGLLSQQTGDAVALIEKLADAVSLAAEFFNARDEMHGAAMRPAITDGIPHQAPITAVMNDTLQAWCDWRYPSHFDGSVSAK